MADAVEFSFGEFVNSSIKEVNAPEGYAIADPVSLSETYHPPTENELTPNKGNYVVTIADKKLPPEETEKTKEPTTVKTPSETPDEPTTVETPGETPDDPTGSEDPMTGDRNIIPYLLLFTLATVGLIVFIVRRKRTAKHVGRFLIIMLTAKIAGSCMFTFADAALSVDLDEPDVDEDYPDIYPYSLTIQKTDENGTPLPGAEFEVYIRPVVLTHEEDLNYFDGVHY